MFLSRGLGILLSPAFLWERGGRVLDVCDVRNKSRTFKAPILCAILQNLPRKLMDSLSKFLLEMQNMSLSQGYLLNISL